MIFPVRFHVLTAVTIKGAAISPMAYSLTLNMKSAHTFKVYFLLFLLVMPLPMLRLYSFNDMMIKECGGGGTEDLGENLSQCHTVHHKSHMT
jgi:hypothetical protein